MTIERRTMVTLHSFNETYQQYQSGLIPCRLVQEQALVMLGICSNPPQTINSALDITDDDIHWLLQQSEASYDYSEYLGGYSYVCETEVDLTQILGCDLEWAKAHSGTRPNVTDIPMAWDACCYLSESVGEPQWVIFLLCWNNAGGPVYYVPKHLWELARVDEHIAATASSL
jgi:hypothetical protein